MCSFTSRRSSVQVYPPSMKAKPSNTNSLPDVMAKRPPKISKWDDGFCLAGCNTRNPRLRPGVLFWLLLHGMAVDQATPAGHGNTAFRDQPQRLRIEAMFKLENACREAALGVAGEHRHRALRDDRA